MARPASQVLGLQLLCAAAGCQSGEREAYLCSAEVEGADVFSQHRSERLQDLHVSHARPLRGDELVDKLTQAERQVLDVEGREALAEGGFYGAEAQRAQGRHLSFAIIPSMALDTERGGGMCIQQNKSGTV